MTREERFPYQSEMKDVPSRAFWIEHSGLTDIVSGSDTEIRRRFTEVLPTIKKQFLVQVLQKALDNMGLQVKVHGWRYDTVEEDYQWCIDLD